MIPASRPEPMEGVEGESVARRTRSKTKAGRAAQSALESQGTPPPTSKRRTVTIQKDISLGLGTEKIRNLPTDIQKDVTQYLDFQDERALFEAFSPKTDKEKEDVLVKLFSRNGYAICHFLLELKQKNTDFDSLKPYWKEAISRICPTLRELDIKRRKTMNK